MLVKKCVQCYKNEKASKFIKITENILFYGYENLQSLLKQDYYFQLEGYKVDVQMLKVMCYGLHVHTIFCLKLGNYETGYRLYCQFKTSSSKF